MNGKGQGRQKVPHLGHVEWKVKYEKGAIKAMGKAGTTGETVAICLTPHRNEINADGQDVALLKVERSIKKAE